MITLFNVAKRLLEDVDSRPCCSPSVAAQKESCATAPANNNERVEILLTSTVSDKADKRHIVGEFSRVDPAKELDRIKALGPVRYLVAPTQLHLWRLEECQDLFPDTELWGPPKITKRFKQLLFAGVLRDAPPDCWAQDLDQTILKGNCFLEELAFYDKKSRTLIMTDFIQNHPIPAGRPFLSLLWRLAGVAYPVGGVPVDVRLSFTDRKLARRSLATLLSWDFDKLVIAHGVCIDRDAKPFVEKAFRWLGH
jgi:hypothetical protein